MRDNASAYECSAQHWQAILNADAIQNQPKPHWYRSDGRE